MKTVQFRISLFGVGPGIYELTDEEFDAIPAKLMGRLVVDLTPAVEDATEDEQAVNDEPTPADDDEQPKPSKPRRRRSA